MAKKRKKKDFTKAEATKKDYVIFGIVGVVALAFIGLIAYAVMDPGQEQFAQCLTDKGTKFYGAFWCGNCGDQKALFGSAIKKVDYIECSLPDRSGSTAICEKEAIHSYPTWEFADGNRVTGVQTLERLSQLSGCPLN